MPDYGFLVLCFLWCVAFLPSAAFAIMFRSQSTRTAALRVVSYNVLSSHLASPSHFTTLNPEHLDAAYRLPLIFKKLEEEIASSQTKNVVLCLQEVSYDWAGRFHAFFANKGYHFVTGLYGKKFNGYMGVAMAYPIESFETVDVDISRLSDKRVSGWPAEPDETMSTKLWKTLRYPFKQVGIVSDPPEDHWSMSARRWNILLTLTLKEKTTGQTFCIATYHMPCAFYCPMAMTLHAEMAAKHIQDVASKREEEGESHPYLLAGDFNIVPLQDMDTGPVYNMLVTGKLDESSPCFPAPKNGMEWSCTIDPMRSAYVVKNGKEPDFTNYARVGEKDPFIGTLDYIFLSPEWTVAGVKELVGRDEADGPFPNANEPSDHILIRADLEIKG